MKIIITEYGVFDPRGLSITEHAVGIAHLASPETREKLLKHIYDSETFLNPSKYLNKDGPRGFFPYENL